MKRRKINSVLTAANSIDDCDTCFLSDVRIRFEQFLKSTNQYAAIQNITDLINIAFL